MTLGRSQIRALYVGPHQRRLSLHARPVVGVCQSHFFRDVVNFWKQMPTTWLQERAKGPKNEHWLTLRRAFCGSLARGPRRVLWRVLRADVNHALSRGNTESPLIDAMLRLGFVLHVLKHTR